VIRTDPRLERILALIAERRQIDFSDYRRDTVWSRLEVRVRACRCAGLDEYEERLVKERDEIDRLVEALVVPVTAFFRDPAVFRAVADRVLPQLIADRGLVRAWVVGAASGEEAYTMAILLAEASSQQRGAGFELIATDLDRASLEVGRAGWYPEKAVQTIPEELRARYFRQERDGHRLSEIIRGRVRFAEHDLVGAHLAPPEAIVASFDIVLCRNVLLYFDPPLRAQASSRLSAVVEPGGALVLGGSEALPDAASAAFRCWPDLSPAAGIFKRGAA
jgi:two-component system CheB/CheR fusion protein